MRHDGKRALATTKKKNERKYFISHKCICINTATDPPVWGLSWNDDDIIQYIEPENLIILFNFIPTKSNKSFECRVALGLAGWQDGRMVWFSGEWHRSLWMVVMVVVLHFAYLMMLGFSWHKMFPISYWREKRITTILMTSSWSGVYV